MFGTQITGHAPSRAPHRKSADQNDRRNPKRNWRSSSLALVIVMKVSLVMSPLGSLKCGVLKRLEASARNCNPKRSVMLIVRNRLKSKFTEPGPNRGLRPTLPYGLGSVPGRVTGANELGS